MEFSIKPKRYYIASAGVSIVSLLLFLSNGVFRNVESLITSSVVGLLPFVIDSLGFLDDTKTHEGSKTFKILRFITKVGIGLIAAMGSFWLLTAIGIFQMPENELTYLIFNPDGLLNRFNFEFLKEILNQNIILAYYIIVFVVSVMIRFTNSHFYRLSLEQEKRNNVPDNNNNGQGNNGQSNVEGGAVTRVKKDD